MKLLINYNIEHGIHKQKCEDTALIGTVVVNDAYGEKTVDFPAWICLCDGVGGNAGGKDASEFVCKSLMNRSAPKEKEDIADTLKTINEQLIEFSMKTENRQKMATTATVLHFSEYTAFLAQVGNTRMYFKRGSFLQQMTEDQTTYQWLLDHGNPEAAETCNRSEIFGAMGGGKSELISSMVTEVFERKLPEVILLTSDGVHEYLTQDKMEEIMDSDLDMSEKAKMLCESALRNGSEDDRSAIVIALGK